jgi:transcriptional regulator with XRE-family HTH domain
MNIKQAIKSLLKYKKTTQTALAEKMGYSGPSGIGQMLQRGNLTVETLIKICDILDYEVTIQPKRGGRRPEGQFIIDNREEGEIE